MRHLILAAALLGALVPAEHARADLDYYFAARGAWSDLEGPRFTTGTDLDFFNTFGYMLVGGVDGGAWRLELEQQAHSSEGLFAFFTEDRMEVDATMLNLVLDPLHGRPFRPYFGAGVGRTRVEVFVDNCYDLSGCPSSPDTHDARWADATQLLFGIAWRPRDADFEFALSHRWMSSGTLGFRTDGGDPYAMDELELSSWVIEVTWFL